MRIIVALLISLSTVAAHASSEISVEKTESQITKLANLYRLHGELGVLNQQLVAASASSDRWATVTVPAAVIGVVVGFVRKGPSIVWTPKSAAAKAQLVVRADAYTAASAAASGVATTGMVVVIVKVFDMIALQEAVIVKMEELNAAIAVLQSTI